MPEYPNNSGVERDRPRESVKSRADSKVRHLTRLALIAIVISAITAQHYLIGVSHENLWLHNIHYLLYFLPILMAGIWYGLWGGVLTAVLVSVLYAPVVFGPHAQHVFASNSQKVLELVIYNLVGWVTGILSYRQRLEGEGYRRAAEELREAYARLREQTDLIKAIDELDNTVRPANYPPDAPGETSVVYDAGDGRLVAVFNLVGRVYMDPNDCPFRTGLELAEKLKKRTPIVIVDMHAEATSEKVAMGIYLDGKVAAVLGTHTTVQPADDRILPGGTACITDVGMTGPHEGVIGVKSEQVLARFVTGIPSRYEVAEKDLFFHGVVIEVDDQTGRAQSIERISRKFDDPDE